jgi:hypothetical protein
MCSKQDKVVDDLLQQLRALQAEGQALVRRFFYSLNPKPSPLNPKP